MKSSIESLAASLKSFPNLNREFGKDKATLLTRKGVFPYEWLDDVAKCLCTSLPDAEAFRSSLKGNKPPDPQDMEYAERIWEKFQMKNFGEYLDVYLKTDCLLLTDIVEAFRDMVMKNFGLDPMNYYTTPGMAWDCLLKFSKVELEPITDPNIFLHFEKQKKGGYSAVHTKYLKANHKYISGYDKSAKQIYIMYFDVNSMYAWAMTQKLPVGKFRWADDEKLREIEGYIERKEYDKIPPCSLNVDLEHNIKNIEKERIFSMCPENVVVDGVKKLTQHLNPKKNYVIHHEAFKYYLKQGMIINKLNSAVLFEEVAWMKGYIEHCITMRKKEGKDPFKKDFWKLMCNANFGKSMENVRNQVDFKLVNNEKALQKGLNRPTLQEIIEYEDDDNGFLYGLHFTKPRVRLHKPIYTGVSILDISKILMYKFLYDYAIPKWGVDKIKVGFTDTDSFLLSIETDDVYADIKPDVPKMFDTSDYPEDNQFGIKPQNKKVLGIMSDEMEGQILTEFIGAGPKNYRFQYVGHDGIIYEKGGCKGVPKHVVPNMNSYWNNLYSRPGSTQEVDFFRLGSKDHIMYLQSVQKVALRNITSKRFDSKDDFYDTVPFGYYKMLAKANEVGAQSKIITGK